MAYKNSWTNSTPADPCTVTIAPDADDFLIGFAISDSTSGTDEDPAGWTRAFRDTSSFDSAVLLVCYKKADGTETSASFGSVGSNVQIAGVASFSGVDTTTPLDVTPVTFTSSTSNTTTSISITPVTNGCDLVFVQGQDGANSDYSFTFSTTSGTTGAWTTRIDQNSGFMNQALGSAVQTTAGALTAQVVSTTGGRLGILFALRPNSSPPVITVQPTNQTATNGGTASFTTTVTGATSYQWETLDPLGGSWGNVSGGSGATSDDYTTGTLSRVSDAGRYYRLKATNADGDTYSEVVVLSVTDIPTSYDYGGFVIGSG